MPRRRRHVVVSSPTSAAHAPGEAEGGQACAVSCLASRSWGRADQRAKRDTPRRRGSGRRTPAEVATARPAGRSPAAPRCGTRRVSLRLSSR
jgi:hypothetical protein